jgi:hypothetical protein
VEDEEKAPLTAEEEHLAASEAELRRLEGRLESLREPQRGQNKQFAKGVALVASLGFVLAGCLLGGLMLGDYLVQRTGHQIFQLVGVLLGLFTALFAGAKLMKPLMKSEE